MVIESPFHSFDKHKSLIAYLQHILESLKLIEPAYQSIDQDQGTTIRLSSGRSLSALGTPLRTPMYTIAPY
jgi:hypothetical protein